MGISDVLWVVHDEGEVGDEDGLCREGVLAHCGRDGGGMEQGYRSHTRDPLHLSYGCLKHESYSKCLCQSLPGFSKCHLDVRQTLHVCSGHFLLSNHSEDLLSTPSQGLGFSMNDLKHNESQ